MAREISKRGAAASPFLAMDVMREANRLAENGMSVMRLEVGQPSSAAPALVQAAAQRALKEDRLGYTDALGVPALRTRIARHYKEQYGLDVSPDRVVVTGGSSSAFILAFTACFDAGARVGLVTPGYPAYRTILTSLEIEPVSIPVGPETDWIPTPELLKSIEADTGPLDGLLIASPANPTGTMLSSAQLSELTDDCRTQQRWFISDEIYHGLSYEGGASTALACDPDSIIINSFSKYYSMTGWRLGWMVLPERLLRPMECLAQNLFISPPTLAQLGALEAFDATEELNSHVDRYATNREILLKGLHQAGITQMAPAQGAFYLYADVSAFTNDAMAFCNSMLHEAGVAATPGLDFDTARGHRFVRFSFAGATADIEEAVRRLQKWVAQF
ncbi:MAG: aminotransferase class I/II-fold pyridoxal phosphate-dependent enzyme [Parvibaculaceae bacterium]|nr:aminotransferase class I/II-fold pyridoxal phosphate-dependent enzyme [Parvibaculaceae bacterium]